MKYSDPRLVEHLASAYALGSLTAGARRRFDRLRRDRSDIDLATLQWEARLGALAQSVVPVRPSPHVWSAIDARTRPLPAGRAATGSGWWKPAGWGLGGVAAGILAATMLFLATPTLFITADRVAMRAGEKLPQSYVGLLTDAQGNGKLLVSSLRHGRTMSIKVIGPITAPAAGRMVLWALPASGPAFALGTVPASGSAVSQLPDTSEKLLSKVGKLVVTLETEAAPTAPSSTVLFNGNCAKLW